MAMWYYGRDGWGDFGPYSGAELKQLAATGKLELTDEVWQEGMSNRVRASQVKGLIPRKGPAAVPSNGGRGDRTTDRELFGAMGLKLDSEDMPDAGFYQVAQSPIPTSPAPVDRRAASAQSDEQSRIQTTIKESFIKRFLPSRGEEPWYYSFLERYAQILMWGGIVLFALLVATVALQLFFDSSWWDVIAYVGHKLSLSGSGSGHGEGLQHTEPGFLDTAFFYVLRFVVRLIVMVLISVILFIILLVPVLLVVAFVLLTVDAARNLRTLRTGLPHTPFTGSSDR